MLLPTVTGVWVIGVVHVVDLAHDFVVDQGKLLPGGKLSAAGVTGKAGKVEY